MDFALEAVRQNARWEERRRDSRNRIDLSMMSEKECKKHFRFSKRNIERLADILHLEKYNIRGNQQHAPFQGHQKRESFTCALLNKVITMCVYRV